VLIATTGVVQFIWFTAAMARSRIEVRTAPSAAHARSRPCRGTPAAAGGAGGRRGAT
jgi:hypothetical protein